MALDLKDDVYALLYSRSVSIASLLPDCTVEESYSDGLQITQHPVEKGATVSDHAFKRSKSVELKIGWSDSTGGSTDYSRQQYEKLIQLQERREPFSVSTSKRNYSNMLVAEIAVTHDHKTKWAIMATVRLQEVRLASVQMGGSGGDAQKGSPEQQQDPHATANTENMGSVQPQGGERVEGAFEKGGILFDTSQYPTVDIPSMVILPPADTFTITPGIAPYSGKEWSTP